MARDHLLDSDLAAIAALREQRDREAWAADFSATSRKERSRVNPLELIISDCHVPYEDVQTWRIFLRAIMDLDPHVVTLLGDVMDLEAASRHPPTGQETFDIEDECGAMRRRLDQLDEALTRADKRYRDGKPMNRRKKRYMQGNHEQRFKKAKAGIDPRWRRTIDSLPEQLDLKGRGWEWNEIPLDVDWRTGRKRRSTQPVMDGELSYHHGESYGRHHAMTQAASRAICQVYGHTHRAQQVYVTYPNRETGELTDTVHVTGLPCASRLFAPWTAQPGMSDWTNGFAVVEHVGRYRFVYPVVIRRDADWTAHAAYGRWRWTVEAE